MSTGFWTASSGALCARHPLELASGACARCGSFTCAACAEGGAHGLCLSCRVRTGTGAFPLTRETWHLAELWEVCTERFRPHWLKLSLAGLLSLVATYLGILPLVAVQAGLQEASAQREWLGLLALPLLVFWYMLPLLQSMGMARLGFDVLEGTPPALARLFAPLRRLGSLLGLLLLVGVGVALLVGLPAVVLIVVLSALQGGAGGGVSDGMGLGLGLLAVGMALVLLGLTPTLLLALMALVYEEGVGPWGALVAGWRLQRGQRLRVFGIVVLGALVCCGGALLCGVGYFPALAFCHLLWSGLYLSLRNGRAAAPA